IYEYIDILSKTQQEMRFSNHARIYLEVCLVKLCQTERVPAQADGPELQELHKKIEALEKEIKRLKTNSQPAVDQERNMPAQVSKRPSRSGGNVFRVNPGTVTQVLKEATRKHLNDVKSQWGE